MNNRIPHTSWNVFASLMLAYLVLAGSVLVKPGQAQAVRPEIMLTQPTPAVSNRLDALRASGGARVAILASEQVERLPQGAQRVRDAVYAWEVFLLGLNVPYTVISDKELNRLSRATRVLVLPASACLSGRQQRAVQAFLRDGGGVIASGMTGYYNDRCRSEDGRFLAETFGGEWVEGLPEQPFGILQALGGNHAPVDGVPSGFRLNIAAQQPLMAVRPTTARGIGRLHTYTTPDPVRDPFAEATMVLYGAQDAGHFFWTRFHPQDVSRAGDQQRVYQTMMINALAYVSGTPSVAVRPWPQGMEAALVMAAMPDVGFDAPRVRTSLGLALDALEIAEAPGTFFLTSTEAGTYPDLVRRIDAVGEVAIAGDTDDVLINQPLETQNERLSTAQAALSRLSAQPVRGLFPPGGFLDANTARAARSAGLGYLLLPPTDVSGAAGHMAWFADADYREVAQGDVRPPMPSRALHPVPTMGRIFHFPLLSRDDYNIYNTEPDGATAEGLYRAYARDFMERRALGGLYILPYHPEFLTQTTSRAAVLIRIAAFARDTGSWVTTLRDVYAWQVQREQVNVRMRSLPDTGLAFDVDNASGTVLEGLTLTIRLDRDDAFDVLGVEADVNIAPDGRSVTLLIPSLPTGTTTITLAYNSRM